MVLSALERAVLERALRGDQPGVVALRAQLTVAEVRRREMTGVGFFTKLAVPPGLAPAIVHKPRFAFGDVQAELGELRYGAGFVVFIANGYLDVLEGFTYGEAWPDNVDRFALRDGPAAATGLSELA